MAVQADVSFSVLHRLSREFEFLSVENDTIIGKNKCMPKGKYNIIVIQQSIVYATSITFFIFHYIIKIPRVRIPTPMVTLRDTTVAITSQLCDERFQFFGILIE